MVERDSLNLWFEWGSNSRTVQPRHRSVDFQLNSALANANEKKVSKSI